MEGYLQPQIIIPVLIVALGIIIWRMFDKRKKQKTETAKPDGKDGSVIKHEPILARVADNITRKIFNRKIQGEVLEAIYKDIPNLGGGTWNRDGKKTIDINRYKDDKGEIHWRRFPIPTGIKNSPQEFHNDMQHPEVEILYDMKEEKSFTDKWGKLIWWIAVIGFIIAIMIQNK